MGSNASIKSAGRRDWSHGLVRLNEESAEVQTASETSDDDVSERFTSSKSRTAGQAEGK